MLKGSSQLAERKTVVPVDTTDNGLLCIGPNTVAHDKIISADLSEDKPYK